ncbi:probable amino acid permease 7 isoform X2 [Phalaenopsis equestris]|nr:probable amino acid permease 7 isoform X2 [Phalaenopsis equestris]
MICFAFVTYISAFMLSECYRSPHPVYGARNYSYMDAVKKTLGKKHTLFCGFLQYLSLFGTSTAYVITTATCMRAIQRSNCYHKEGHSAPCSGGDSFFMLMFGVVQIFVSQIPDFHNMQWLSVVAATMSFTYSFIGFGLGLAKVIGNGRINGGIGGVHTASVHTASTAQKVWKVSQAIGDVAFAYPYSIIVIEIQDTLKSPPQEHQTMKKASMASIIITTFFYLCCGCFGYAAFGDDTPGNLLTGFGFYEPYWLVDLANSCIILHLIGGYQVFSQPIFAFFERQFSEKLPSSWTLTNCFHRIHLPFLPSFRINLFRIFFRTLYVASTTGLALGFPYFNQVLALLGAISFWPLAIYFPVEMYSVQKKIAPWTSRWFVLQAFSVGCLLVSIFALIGSIEGLFSQRL